ncbi:hypothetical protein ABZY45_32540 [Streptomyces sp. NPDC006516]|uniref:hypothetical protein n=1 Tax=Streptomyces sp. NPDC006516 TaxID=3154309 RepID=UPI0033B5610E
MVAARPDLGPELVTELGEDPDEDVRMRVRLHPLPRTWVEYDVIDRVIGHGPECVCPCTEPDPDPASVPSPDWFAACAVSGEPVLRRVAASWSDLPAAFVGTLAQDDDEEVRIRLAFNHPLGSALPAPGRLRHPPGAPFGPTAAARLPAHRPDPPHRPPGSPNTRPGRSRSRPDRPPGGRRPRGSTPGRRRQPAPDTGSPGDPPRRPPHRRGRRSQPLPPCSPYARAPRPLPQPSRHPTNRGGTPRGDAHVANCHLPAPIRQTGVSKSQVLAQLSCMGHGDCGGVVRSALVRCVSGDLVT